VKRFAFGYHLLLSFRERQIERRRWARRKQRLLPILR